MDCVSQSSIMMNILGHDMLDESLNVKLNSPQIDPATANSNMWGFQPFKEGILLTVFTPDCKPMAQAMIMWEQVDLLKQRAVNPAPFKCENTPLSPFSPKDKN